MIDYNNINGVSPTYNVIIQMQHLLTTKQIRYSTDASYGCCVKTGWPVTPLLEDLSIMGE
jgi:hypothetical protein